MDYEKWHDWLAWYPVRMTYTDEMVWFKVVRRRLVITYHITCFGSDHEWQYKIQKVRLGVKASGLHPEYHWFKSNTFYTKGIL